MRVARLRLAALRLPGPFEIAPVRLPLAKRLDTKARLLDGRLVVRPEFAAVAGLRRRRPTRREPLASGPPFVTERLKGLAMPVALGRSKFPANVGLLTSVRLRQASRPRPPAQPRLLCSPQVATHAEAAVREKAGLEGQGLRPLVTLAFARASPYVRL